MADTPVTRRAALGAGLLVLPGRILRGAQTPSRTLNLAGVGVGAMGGVYLRNCETENIVALCDVDDAYAARTYARYPKARRYRDFRRMLEAEKGIDAVVIGTPDHTHAVIAMAAIALGKHVYCAKPLTRTIAEARRLAKAATEARVATQMSVQSCSSEAACETVEMVRSGRLGPIRQVHVWSDRPVWPQALARPTAKVSVPDTLAWDLWLGPAPARPYHPAYHPFVWRGWYDFGTGALGDMGCHAFHVVMKALDLDAPVSISASVSRVIESSLEMVNGEPRLRPKTASFAETFPHASLVTWEFAARGSQPPVRLHWYDGGLKPPRPPGLPADHVLPNGGGAIYEGDQGSLVTGFTGGTRWLPESLKGDPPPKTEKRSTGHYSEWIEACKGGPAASCEFGFGARVTELALLGVLAQRHGKPVLWDSAALRVTNDDEANRFLAEPARTGW